MRLGVGGTTFLCLLGLSLLVLPLPLPSVVLVLVVPVEGGGVMWLAAPEPPCEQVLAAVVVGALLFCCGVVDMVWVVVSS